MQYRRNRRPLPRGVSGVLRANQRARESLSKTALITGITGQDGSYLAELPLEKGYTVHGIVRRNSEFTTQRINSILFHPRLETHHGDMVDSSNLFALLSRIKPDEVYH